MNMFNNNNGFGGFGGYPNFQQQQQPGMVYNQRPQARMTQPLTDEEIKKLRSNGASFDLAVSPTDALKAVCTHKHNGNIMLQDTGDGNRSRCSICGEEFNLIYSDPQQVEEAVSVILDVLQTIKTTFLDIPEETARNFFMVIPLLKKVPALYKIAMANFNQYDNTNMTNQTGSQFGFNALNAFASPAYGMGVPGMNNYGQQNFQQPMPNNFGQMPMNNMGYQQPYGQPMMGQNPFMYDQNAQQPMNNQAQQQAAPQTNNNQNQSKDNTQQNNDSVKVQRVFNV